MEQRPACVTLVNVTPRLRLAKEDLEGQQRGGPCLCREQQVKIVPRPPVLEETLISPLLLFQRTLDVCPASIEANTEEAPLFSGFQTPLLAWTLRSSGWLPDETYFLHSVEVSLPYSIFASRHCCIR